MADDSATANLQVVLEQCSKRISKPAGTVLFRCGEKASGMYVVLSGRVSLEAGDWTLAYTYGPGALVGLPSTITRRNYTMTATVTEDAELGLLSPEELDSILHDRPELCHQLLMILGNRMSENLALVSTSVKRPA
jgi:CRP-like cAMP-binding protein